MDDGHSQVKLRWYLKRRLSHLGLSVSRSFHIISAMVTVIQASLKI